MNNIMESRRVLLLSAQPLLSEGLIHILGLVEDVEVIGPWDLDAGKLAQLSDEAPDIVLIAEQEGEYEVVASFTARVMEHHPDLPIIHVGLSQNVVRVYTSHTLPARSSDLIETIRNLPSRRHGGTEGS